jgi:hypothetical protein
MATQQVRSTTWQHERRFYAATVFATIVYLLALFSVHYEPGQSNIRLLINLSIGLPAIAIWFLAARSATRFKQYSQAIKKSKDGAGLNDIADALLWMVTYIIVLIIISPLSGLFKDTAYLTSAVALANHVPIIFALVSAGLFYRGALRLNSIVPLRISPIHNHMITALGVFAACLFTLYFYREVPQVGLENGLPRFVGHIELLVFTYAMPHLLMWGLGAYASLSLLNYSLRVKGEIYKRSFRTLYKGVLLVFVCTFIAQLLMASAFTLSKLNPLLLVIYGLLSLGIYGFVLIYRGAAKLHQIENI